MFNITQFNRGRFFKANASSIVGVDFRVELENLGDLSDIEDIAKDFIEDIEKSIKYWSQDLGL